LSVLLIDGCSRIARRDYNICATDIFDFHTPPPPNVDLYYEDANKGLAWTSNSFGYVHIRALAGCIEDWKSLFQNAFLCLKNGGYIEYYDISLEFARWLDIPGRADVWSECSNIIRQVTTDTGRAFHVSIDECKAWMKDAGFNVVNEAGGDMDISDPNSDRLAPLPEGCIVLDCYGAMPNLTMSWLILWTVSGSSTLVAVILQAGLTKTSRVLRKEICKG
jgi:hypothetical protein